MGEQLLGNLSLARSAVHLKPMVLKASATTLQACWKALVHRLGEEQARYVVTEEPRVLCSSAMRFDKLWSDVLLQANFDAQRACDMVVQQPTKYLVAGICLSNSSQSEQEL